MNDQLEKMLRRLAAAEEFKKRAPIPEKVRKSVLQRADYCCENCGRKLPLEMHHITYRVDEVCDGYRHDKGYGWVKNEDGSIRIIDGDIFGNETPDVLLALCRECHLAEHIDLAGDFWIDPDEKADYWWSFFNAIDKD